MGVLTVQEGRGQERLICDFDIMCNYNFHNLIIETYKLGFKPILNKVRLLVID
jgi:hypothetical protein